ncbi:MAG: hypothetical protein HYS09_01420 [Chloroflexi bacterium]|nr:hypothetical protein [Chloroflexota bacterium]
MARRPLTVAFLGIHGSGKTTQARLLCGALRERGITARYVHHLAAGSRVGRWTERHVARPILAASSRLLGGRPGDRPRPAAPAGRALRRALATLTAARGVVRFQHVDAGAAVVAFDRHAYDSMARARWLYGVPALGERWLLRRTPMPGLIVFLDAEPQDACRRHKGQEWSASQLERQAAAYREFMRLLRTENRGVPVYTVPAHLPVEQVHAEVLAAVMRLLGPAGRSRPAAATPTPGGTAR